MTRAFIVIMAVLVGLLVAAPSNAGYGYNYGGYKALLPPETTALPFRPEDPRVLALLRGQSIPRTDFAFVMSYMASRVHKQRAAK